MLYIDQLVFNLFFNCSVGIDSDWVDLLFGKL